MLKYGLKKNTNELLHIDSDYVKNGVKCDCICPECKDSLVAKNRGEFKEHHFAHHSRPETEKCRMTQLHLVAQDFFFNSKKFIIPEVLFEHKSEGLTYPETSTVINSAQKEYRVDRYSADVFLCTDHTDIAIEVCVTHENEEEKTAYYCDNKIPSIEYDLSSYLNLSIDDAIKDLKESKVPYKWLYEWCRESLIQEFEKKLKKEIERVKRIRLKNATNYSYSLIKNKEIDLPPLNEKFKTEVNGRLFHGSFTFYKGGVKKISKVVHINTSNEYFLLKGTHGPREIWIVLLLVDYIPEFIENLKGSIIVRNTPASSNEGFTIRKVKYDNLIKKIESKRLDFFQECSKETKKIDSAKAVLKIINQHVDLYLKEEEKFSYKNYRIWKRWMENQKLFKSTASMPNPKIPQPLKCVRIYPSLWVFDTWKILSLSYLAEIIDSYPLNENISLYEIFEKLAQVTNRRFSR
ncbi:hypothetical protein [Marinomonas algarum]|uniref:Competence protein CoiA-like family protein n=1 Tax=Marinomonas algarum TaxID=2883105 RepID=A0A9X1LFE4_9GAMM|nr:hypothetical protein [Marinomonas algarum]MCB5162942.1 hypothetical protein [Marinomonas algarum]